MIWIRSLLFQFYFYVSVVVAAAAVVVCAALPYRFRFAIARCWGVSMLWAGRELCGLEYVLEGRENIPASACVFMIKHTTVFEIYAQLALLPAQSWVLKRELLWIPLFGWGLASMKPIAINRQAGRSAITQVREQGKARLADGVCLSIFPEGTRVRLGETKRYGVGGAAVALDAGVLLVPIAHNAGDFWPRRGLLKRPGLIRFCVGPPIDPAGRTPRATSLLVQAWIESKMAEVSCGYQQVAASKQEHEPAR